MKNMKKIILLAACLFAAFATADASEGAVKNLAGRENAGNGMQGKGNV